MIEQIKNYWPYLVTVAVMIATVTKFLVDLTKLKESRLRIKELEHQLEALQNEMIETEKLIKVATVEQTERYGSIQTKLSKTRRPHISSDPTIDYYDFSKTKSERSKTPHSRLYSISWIWAAINPLLNLNERKELGQKTHRLEKYIAELKHYNQALAEEYEKLKLSPNPDNLD